MFFCSWKIIGTFNIPIFTAERFLLLFFYFWPLNNAKTVVLAPKFWKKMCSHPEVCLDLLENEATLMLPRFKNLIHVIRKIESWLKISIPLTRKFESWFIWPIQMNHIFELWFIFSICLNPDWIVTQWFHEFRYLTQSSKWRLVSSIQMKRCFE